MVEGLAIDEEGAEYVTAVGLLEKKAGDEEAVDKKAAAEGEEPV